MNQLNPNISIDDLPDYEPIIRRGQSINLIDNYGLDESQMASHEYRLGLLENNLLSSTHVPRYNNIKLPINVIQNEHDFIEIITQRGRVLSDANTLFNIMFNDIIVLKPPTMIETFISKMYYSYFKTNICNLRTNSPNFFRDITLSDLPFRQYEKFIYLLSFIKTMSLNDTKIMTMLDQSDRDKLIEWTSLRKDNNIDALLNGPISNVEYHLDYIKLYDILINPTLTYDDMISYRTNTLLQNLETHVMSLYSHIRSLNNVYDKTLDYARKVTLNITINANCTVRIDEMNRLKYNLVNTLQHLPMLNDNTIQINKYGDPITKDYDDTIQSVPILPLKRFEQLLNRYSTIKLVKFSINSQLYVNDLINYDPIYIIFDGITATMHNIITGENVHDMAVFGCKVTKQSKQDGDYYNLVPYNDVTYQSGDVTLHDFNLIISNFLNNSTLDIFNPNIVININNLYNIPIQIRNTSIPITYNVGQAEIPFYRKIDEDVVRHEIYQMKFNNINQTDLYIHNTNTRCMGIVNSIKLEFGELTPRYYYYHPITFTANELNNTVLTDSGNITISCDNITYTDDVCSYKKIVINGSMYLCDNDNTILVGRNDDETNMVFGVKDCLFWITHVGRIYVKYTNDTKFVLAIDGSGSLAKKCYGDDANYMIQDDVKIESSLRYKVINTSTCGEYFEHYDWNEKLIFTALSLNSDMIITPKILDERFLIDDEIVNSPIYYRLNTEWFISSQLSIINGLLYINGRTIDECYVNDTHYVCLYKYNINDSPSSLTFSNGTDTYKFTNIHYNDDTNKLDAFEIEYYNEIISMMVVSEDGDSMIFKSFNSFHDNHDVITVEVIQTSEIIVSISLISIVRRLRKFTDRRCYTLQAISYNNIGDYDTFIYSNIKVPLITIARDKAIDEHAGTKWNESEPIYLIKHLNINQSNIGLYLNSLYCVYDKPLLIITQDCSISCDESSLVNIATNIDSKEKRSLTSTQYNDKSLIRVSVNHSDHSFKSLTIRYNAFTIHLLNLYPELIFELY